MAKSPHGYDTKSWNPTSGCTKVSAGCENCWAEAYSRRTGWPWKVTLHPDRLGEPLTWRKPQVAAVCYMGDLFHPEVTAWFIGRVFLAMRAASRHTFLVLTKRPKRMAALRFGALPNVWLGVSVENQSMADKRIPLLLDTPAAHRWVSAEPLLEPVDLAPWLPNLCSFCGRQLDNRGTCRHCSVEFEGASEGVDAVVVGGESGTRHRPCDPAWIADIVRQCDAAQVPVYVKQASHRYPGRQGDIPDDLWARKEVAWETS